MRPKRAEPRCAPTRGAHRRRPRGGRLGASKLRQKADGKEWSLWWSPFLRERCHLTRWLLPTLPDRLAAPRSLRSAALHSAPFPRTADGLVSWRRATGRRHGPRGEGIRPERSGRQESDSWDARRIRGRSSAACNRGCGGDRHGGR
jgi:hypothetical protein